MLVCKKKQKKQKHSEDRMLHFLRLNDRTFFFFPKHMQCDEWLDS